MNTTIYGLLSVLVMLVVGTHVDVPRSQAQAATGIAYAVISKVKKAEAKCKDCKCEDCKCTEKCECLVSQVKPVWKWFRNGNTGEHRLLDGERVLQVQKFKLENIYGKSCNGGICKQVLLGQKWVKVQ